MWVCFIGATIISMDRFFKEIKRKTIRAIENPDFVFPYIKGSIEKEFSKKNAEKILLEHGGELVASGTEKKVFRVPFRFRDGSIHFYAVAFIYTHTRLESRGREHMEKMRNTREWYRKILGDKYVNTEHLFLSKGDEKTIIYVQPFLQFKEGKRDLFQNIVKNLDEILMEMKNNSDFFTDMKTISKRVLLEYSENGLLPDFYNHFASVEGKENPANMYLTEDNRILFTDMHTAFYDTRIKNNKEALSTMSFIPLRDDDIRLQYTDELIHALHIISNQ